MPRASMVVPVIVSTNDGEWLGPCLSSLMSGSRKPDWVIVIANHCVDNTASTAAAFGDNVLVRRTPTRLGFAACNNCCGVSSRVWVRPRRTVLLYT